MSIEMYYFSKVFSSKYNTKYSGIYGAGTISKIGILHIPKRYRSAYIIDGQHRLYGYSDSLYAETNTIPVVAFVDLERSEQIKLFMDINENQKEKLAFLLHK